jgi:hypothetical protein
MIMPMPALDLEGFNIGGYIKNNADSLPLGFVLIKCSHRFFNSLVATVIYLTCFRCLLPEASFPELPPLFSFGLFSKMVPKALESLLRPGQPCKHIRRFFSIKKEVTPERLFRTEESFRPVMPVSEVA